MSKYNIYQEVELNKVIDKVIEVTTDALNNINKESIEDMRDEIKYEVCNILDIEEL